MTITEPARRLRNPLASFWEQFTRFAEAMEVTEVEILSERVARLEREIGKLRSEIQAMAPHAKWQEYMDSPEYRLFIGS